MDIELTGIVIIVGAFGSGKTEIAINLAANRKFAGLDVRIADLDLINPYFRTREARVPLTAAGIEVVLPPERYLQADLPILSPLVAGMIKQPAQLTLLDAGGNEAGATVLASLADAFANRPARMLQVINSMRPFSDTVQGCLQMRDEIQHASGMAVNGIIGNTNLMDETTVADIYRGYDFVKSVSARGEMPIEFITVARELLPDIDLHRFACPVLPIDRQLVPPWRRAKRFRKSSLEA